MIEYKLLGIDDSARFPVLGSMFIAGILIPLSKIDLLKKIKVKDSKLCTKNQILEKGPKLMRNFRYKVLEVPAKQISNYNINDLEAKAFYDIYSVLHDEKTVIYADNFDYSREKFLERMKKLGFEFDNDKWVISHDCDKNYMACSAASIIAKYHHNQHIEQLHKTYGDIGNLNPGNPKTLNFIKNNLDNLPEIVRIKYITVQRLYQEIK